MAKVRERLVRATMALRASKVPYAVADGNAVAVWVAAVDETAVRNTQEVDIFIRRSDFESAKAALQAAGFSYRHSAGLDIFLDGPDHKARNAVHILFAGEKMKEYETTDNPDVV